MNNLWFKVLLRKQEVSKVAHGMAAAALVLLPAQFSFADISQTPLYLGGGGVPGNMVLTPSVEWPTIESVANLDSSYSSTKRFEGYFDSGKCYQYSYSETESERHFYPSSTTANRQCTGVGECSGNFLNWATTQTIDPFRKVLTGGLRVKDTPTETWLEKARHQGQGSGFPIRDLNNASQVAGATPFEANRIRVRISGLQNKLRFSINNYDYNNDVRTYNPATSNVDRNRGFEMSVRVKVCDPTVGVEDNCRQYSQGWKPEGLIQQYAKEIRFSVFGYLNDSGDYRDGGVLRAKQKYVGPQRLVAGQGMVDNPNKEWNPVTGVFVTNPDAADATASGVSNSGVINYINKFGQLNVGENNKSNDPVSELYYAATRYLKNLGNVPEYTSMAGANSTTQARYKDGFPVITDWDDPIAYQCQANVILGIGDANTHDDKNLPGNTSYRSGQEPAMPDLVAADTSVNVVTATNRVGIIEGFDALIGQTSNFSGRENSAYIAGLAYDNRTMDIRPNMPGKQTVSTHWVDVLENQVLQQPRYNQYYLAAKYGGFTVPNNYGDPYTRTDPLPEAWWHTNGETLTPNNGSAFKRPDNYYLAGQAEKMIASLREAFKNVAAELSSSAASVATNSTSLETDTAIYQAAFNSTRWSGDVKSFEMNENGTLEGDHSWSAAEELDDLTEPEIASRKIFTIAPLANNNGNLLSTTGAQFTWEGLTESQKEALRSNGAGEELVSVSLGQQRLAYLRGSRAQEQTLENQARPFRQRDSRLGDVINSNPQYIHKDDYGYRSLHVTSAFHGITTYQSFRSGETYQQRIPMVIVGANDGMLHGFNADDESNNKGKEVFAYVPAGVYGDLYRLTQPDYSHRYYVDGTPRIADAWLGETLGWRTIVAGTTGAGGKSVFVLDVTNPTNMTASNVLWEFSHQDMGYTIQQPAVVALANGTFGVVVTSGHDSPADNGKIWILNAATGSPIKVIELPTGEKALGAPLVVDVDNDRIGDRIYVGDTGGKIWRVDITGSNTNSWGVPAGLKQGNNLNPLFSAATGQQITAPLTAAKNEKGEVMLFFGTGSFVRVGDNVVPENPTVESFYGIIDNEISLTRNGLVAQSILAQQAVNGKRYRVISNNAPTTPFNGWYLNLVFGAANGERNISKALVRGDRVIFTTMIPSADPCAAGGDSWLMELNMYSGSRLNYSVFDVNGDGVINDDDFIEVDGERIPAGGLAPDIGIINTPTIITHIQPGDNEAKVISGSSGAVETVLELGSVTRGRKSWEQLR